jgi:hypothetical protein
MHGGKNPGPPIGNTNVCGKDEDWRRAVLAHRQRKAEARERHCAMVLESVYHYTPEMLAKVKEIGGSYEQAMEIAYATWAKRHGLTILTETSPRALKAQAAAIVGRARTAGLLPARRRRSRR